MKKIIDSIKSLAKNMPPTTIMEVCGGHTNVIVQYGIRNLLPENIRLVSGPGCPVCVTSQHDIDCVIELALNKVKIAAYGDVMRVPGTRMTLDDARGKGAIIKEIYSVTEVLEKDYVFFAIGFETTTPMTAYALSKGMSVYSSHKIMIPAMKALLSGDLKIDGFITPGHVSAILGSREWKLLNVPQVISGFKPEQVLTSIEKILQLISRRKKSVVNNYEEVVRPEGNRKAKKMMMEQLKLVDSDWRGIGNIPLSGLEVRKPKQNAKKQYNEILKKVNTKEFIGCRCGDVLKGLLEPEDCPLYKEACTPATPKGACMVSAEGACSITYKYGKI
ncbi:MAG: hydrogenase formation protein HypD [Nanoarchaeota archaeon]|nr:hydrogenase formation protein HypD [Nanoarchaeota archaeon]